MSAASWDNTRSAAEPLQEHKEEQDATSAHPCVRNGTATGCQHNADKSLQNTAVLPRVEPKRGSPSEVELVMTRDGDRMRNSCSVGTWSTYHHPCELLHSFKPPPSPNFSPTFNSSFSVRKWQSLHFPHFNTSTCLFQGTGKVSWCLPAALVITLMQGLYETMPTPWEWGQNMLVSLHQTTLAGIRNSMVNG